MTSWQKINHKGKGKAPPYWLEVRPGKYKTSYRIRFRRDGLNLNEVLDGEFRRWEDARDAGDAIIQKARFGDKPKPKSLVTCASLCDEILAYKKAKGTSTYDQAELFFRLHIKPFLEENCQYAAELNATVWQKYRTDFRLKYPDRPLFNHRKFFGQVFKLAFEKGIIPKVKLEYSEKKDDNRKAGQIIPDSALRAFLFQANRAWTDRTKIQRLTGQRPSVIRRLRKDFIDFERSVAKIPREESKNRRSYEFKLPKAVIDILKTRLDNGSAYFFPSELDKSQPMDKHLKGWHAAWRRAGYEKMGYTPHDIRHTFLTEKVGLKANTALLCFSCDLSLEEMQKTYLHFTADNTQELADESDARAAALFGEGQ